jgi:hypothetical protein
MSDFTHEKMIQFRRQKIPAAGIDSFKADRARNLSFCCVMDRGQTGLSFLAKSAVKLHFYEEQISQVPGSGGVVRLSISPSQGGDPGFKSRPEHHFFIISSQNVCCYRPGFVIFSSVATHIFRAYDWDVFSSTGILQANKRLGF